MGRGSSSGGGSRGSSSSGGSSRGSSSWGSSRGWSSSSRGSSWSSSRGTTRNTVIIGGHTHHSNGGSGNGRSIPIILGIFFLFLFGLPLVILSINSFFEYNRYDTVVAECIDNTYIDGWYYTTYNYTINGTNYTSTSDLGWEYPETDDYEEIYYLKSNPYYITEENPVDLGTSIPILIGGLLFSTVGVLSIVIGAKSRKKTANNTPIEEPKIINTSQSQETVNRCSYCGSKYDKSLHSCPNCGADN